MSQGSPAGYRNLSNGSNPSLPVNGIQASPQTRPAQAPNLPHISRAEKFEDEKRRIIESCFSKQEPNGQLAESYITHIRIQEDSQHPSAPPPPESAPENKKPRLIIIAVRSTGRVRMHKARENNNGSFSIGKTWNMEELSAIEGFSPSFPPQNEREAQARLWAGNTGFIVTITKSYYWQASSATERDFFIASIVKIYRKYTKGQVPELRGFDDQQTLAILGTSTGQPQTRRLQGSNGPGGQSDRDSPAPPQPPFASRPHGRDESRYRDSPGPPPSFTDHDSRAPSTARFRAPSAGQSPGGFNEHFSPGPKPFASTEQLRPQGSREGLRHDNRPGTAPNSGGYRTPPISGGSIPPLPVTPSGPSSQTPLNGTPHSGRDRPQSPLRNEGLKDGPQDTFASLGVTAGVAAGAELLLRSQKRLAEHVSPPSSPPTASRPPPLEPNRSFDSEQRYGSPTRTLHRQESNNFEQSDASPFDDKLTFDMVSPVLASSRTDTLQSDATSPPTPERSKRRPPLETAPSETNIDLLPLPLNARSKHTNNLNAVDTTPRDASQLSPDARYPDPLSPAKSKFDFDLAHSGQNDTQLSSANLPPESLNHGEGLDHARLQTKDESDHFRSGFGGMMKKKEVADRFKKAANAAGAFKPRPGGAAEKILRAKAEREANGAAVAPDGITGVVPRPTAQKTDDKDVLVVAGAAATGVAAATTVASHKQMASREMPSLEASRPPSAGQNMSRDAVGGTDTPSLGIELRDDNSHLVQEAQEQLGPEVHQTQTLAQQQQAKIKRRSAQHLRYLEELGVDSSLLADSGIGFESLLYDFGWADAHLSSKSLTNMENDLRREQTKLEAGAWLSGLTSEPINAKDDKEKQVISLLDRAIQECDEMDGLLTIYHVELSSLNEDIVFIEAQSQGLQVQSANQRILHTELSSLLQTMSLDKRTLEPLKRADLGDIRGVEDAEGALIKLYQAIITIDPTVRSNAVSKRKSRGAISDGDELSSISALRQKREVYEQESGAFCARLLHHLDLTFKTSLGDAKFQVVESTGSGTVKLRKSGWDEARQPLWMYGPLILYVKELDLQAWQSLLQMYQSSAKSLYAESFRKNITSWKRAVKKSSGDESEILFTAMEKDEPAASGGALSSARKMTVKRSQTLARTLRHTSAADKSGPTESRSTGSLMPCEVFAGSVDEMAVLISQEQNFIVDLFHVSSFASGDFIDAVKANRPSDRHATNLQAPQPPDPDREMARQVTGTMGDIFGFFSPEMSSLLDWAIVNDPLQGVGIMACLGRHAFFLQESSQDFLMQLIEQLGARLQNLFTKFVAEQVRAIEETKVKIKKRKGVIGFIKVFPHFSSAVENVFSSVAGADYENEAACMADTRLALDEAYAKINRAMFDSLKIIAKESPNAVPQTANAGKTSEDPEDKEQLNHHILLIENMNHYIEEVDDGGKEGVLAEWKGKALLERAEALDMYVGRVIRRPLGKLLDFLDSLDSVKEAHPHNPAAITSRPTYSRKAARNTFAPYDGKEIRRGIETLRKRIEKHFGDAENDPSHSRALVNFVCKECERAYDRTVTRCETAIKELYPPAEGEKPVELEFSKADVQAGFKR